MKHLFRFHHLSFILIIGLHSCTPIEGDVLIQNITTIDAINGVNENQSVLITGNRITSIQESSNGLSAKKSIDGSGKFMIPGLWDAHVHLTFEKAIEPHMFDLFIANGITSIRDTGGQIERMVQLKEQAMSNPKKHPRVKIAGPLIDGLPRVYDGSSVFVPDISKGVSTPEEAKAYVKELDEAGVDLIKAYEMLTPELFTAIMEEATERGLKVTGHIPLQMTVQQASDLGMASVEHMRNLEMSMVDKAEEKRDQRAKIIAASQDSLGYGVRSRLHTAYRFSSVRETTESAIAGVLHNLEKNQTWQIPTLALILSSELKPWDDADWLETFTYLPSEARTEWEQGAQQMPDVPVAENQQQYMDWASKMISDLHQNNIPIMAGTDCPIFFLTPGFSLHRELQVLVEKGGLEPMQALKASTYNPALYFDMQDDLGTIDTGKIADLLILDANPIDNIRNTTAIQTVIKDGYVYDRQSLDDLLN